MSKRKYSRKKRKKESRFDLAHLIYYLIIGLVPHIFLYEEYTPLASEKLYFKADNYIDLLMLAKTRLFLVLAMFLLLVFISHVVKKKFEFKFDNFTKLAAVFFFIAVLSTIFSKYSDIAFWGAKDRYEGLLAITGYLILLIAGRYYFANRDFREKAKKVFIISATINGMIGILQISGVDIYLDTFLKYLLIPSRILNNLSIEISTSYDHIGAVASLYNPNYFGVYISLALAISVTTMFESNKKILFHISNAILIFVLFASRSETGVISVIVFLILYFLLNFNNLIKQKLSLLFFLTCFFGELLLYHKFKGIDINRYKYLIFVLIAGIAASIIINVLILYKLKISNRIKSASLTVIILASTVFGLIAFIYISPSSQRDDKLISLAIFENEIHMNIERQGDIKVIADESSIELFINNENKPLTQGNIGNRFLYIGDGLTYTFDLYKTVQMQGTDQYKFVMWPGNLNILYASGNLIPLDLADNIVRIDRPRGIAFLDQRGNVFSGRGYIWSKSIYTITKSPVIGHGPDTFAMVFPQNDFIGVYNELLPMYKGAFTNTLIDKPHSAYIQVFYGMGIINFLIFLILIIFGIYKGIKDHLDKKESLSYLCALIVFAIGSIFNDSTVAITAVMLCFIAALYRIRDKESS